MKQSPQLICDGVHLHPAVVKITINAKTNNNVILITDSIEGAGLPDGDYDNNGQKFVCGMELPAHQKGDYQVAR